MKQQQKLPRIAHHIALTAQGPLFYIHSFSLFLFCALAFLAMPAAADPATPATPAVIGTQPLLDHVTDFKAQPLAILARFPTAGAAMASFVAQLVSKEPTMIDALLSIMNVSTPEQSSAMGAGLVRATRVLLKDKPELARALAEKVGQSDNLWLKTTFTALGYKFTTVAYYSSPGALPPATTQNFAGGNALPPTRSRLGPPERSDTIVLSDRNQQTFYKKSNADQPFGSGGMIVAVVKSDAPANGAYSTSPTN